MPKTTLGATIRAARESLGLSQAALADAAGLEQSAVSRIEVRDHEPGAFTLHKIARALGTTSDDLISGSVKFTPRSKGAKAKAVQSDLIGRVLDEITVLHRDRAMIMLALERIERALNIPPVASGRR